MIEVQHFDRILAKRGALAGSTPTRPAGTMPNCPALRPGVLYDRRDPSMAAVSGTDSEPRSRASTRAQTRHQREPPAITLRPRRGARGMGSENGHQAPPSRFAFPSICTGNGLFVAEAVKMPTVPGVALFPPGANRIWAARRLGSNRRRRALHNFYGTQVCAVDADGNEVARASGLPPIAVAASGTYTGWNVISGHSLASYANRERGTLIPFVPSAPEASAKAAGDTPPLARRNRYGSPRKLYRPGRGRRPPDLSLTRCAAGGLDGPPLISMPRGNAIGSERRRPQRTGFDLILPERGIGNAKGMFFNDGVSLVCWRFSLLTNNCSPRPSSVL